MILIKNIVSIFYKIAKKTNNGWKTIPFKQGALFPKTLYEIKAHENSPFQCELLLEYFYQVPLASGIYRCTFANPIVFEITENGEGKVLQITSPKMGDIEG